MGPTDPSPSGLPGDTAEDLYENAPCGYFSTLPDGTIVRVNATFLRWTGLRREDLVGRRRMQDLLSVGGRIFYESHYYPLLRLQGAVREVALEIMCADGRTLPVLLNSVRRTDAAGNPVTLTTVFDATDRREYERELMRSRRRAEQSEARVRVLQETAAALAGAAGVADVARVLVEAAGLALRADGAGLWLIEDDPPVLVRVAASGIVSAPALERVPVPLRGPGPPRFDDLVVLESLDAARGRFPAIAEVLAETGVATLVSAPLVVDDRLRAVLALGTARPDPGRAGPSAGAREDRRPVSDPADRDLLRTLARQGGQALGRALLYESESRLRREAEALQRLTAALAPALDPARIAEAAVTELVESGVVDQAVLAVVDEHSGRLRVLGARGVPADAVLRAGDGALPGSGEGALPGSGEGALPGSGDGGLPGSGDGALPGPDDGSSTDELPAEPGRGTTVLPLHAGERRLGVLWLGFDLAPRSETAGRALLESFAGQCAQALERARLHGETVERGRRAAVLARVGRALEEAPGLMERSRRLVDILVPDLADAATVELVGPTGPRLAATAPPGWSPAPSQRGPGRVADAVKRARATGDAQVVEAAPEPGRPASGRAVVLPLGVPTLALGALVLSYRAERVFPAAELSFLEDLAERAALGLENARLYEYERDVAHTLQRSLLTGEPSVHPAVRVATRYLPAVETLEVGGDWYDSFALPGGRLGVAVGDVVGRGLEAASAMGQLRSAIRALAGAELGPARLIEHLDAFAGRLDAGRLATLAYAEIDVDTGLMRYACAGHPPPLLMDESGRPRYLWEGRSAPLRAYGGDRHRVEAEVTLPPGSRLLLYTDGLVERRTRSLDRGLDELAVAFDRHRLKPLAILVDDLADGMLADEVNRDDVCLLCVSFAAAPTFTRTLRADPHQLAPMRDDLRGWLAGHRIGGRDADAVVLACSEAAGNAIEHGYGGDGSGVVTVHAGIEDGGAALRVEDAGRWREGPGTPNRGRGLQIIERVMDRVDVRHSDGTTVSMYRRLGRADQGAGAGAP